MRRSLRQVFAWPTVIGMVSAVGLVTALVDDGPGDWIAWAALALPVVVFAWAWRRRT